MSTSGDTPGDLEPVREWLNVITQETRLALLQDILGHPSELPTLKELDYVNPGAESNDDSPAPPAARRRWHCRGSAPVRESPVERPAVQVLRDQ